MKIRLFVSLSAALLSLWLAATYVRVVPMETYSGDPAPAHDAAMVEMAPDLEAPAP